jgi:hypothetical protein
VANATSICAALLLAACRTSPSASTTSTTNSLTDLPGLYPNFVYPVTDPALPSFCGLHSDEQGSSEIRSIDRQNGGAIEVTARVIPIATWTFAVSELAVFDNATGNCFYSSKVIQRGHKLSMVVGSRVAQGPWTLQPLLTS